MHCEGLAMHTSLAEVVNGSVIENTIRSGTTVGLNSAGGLHILLHGPTRSDVDHVRAPHLLLR
jgi:hypothetical protein